MVFSLPAPAENRCVTKHKLNPIRRGSSWPRARRNRAVIADLHPQQVDASHPLESDPLARLLVDDKSLCTLKLDLVARLAQLSDRDERALNVGYLKAQRASVALGRLEGDVLLAGVRDT